MANPGFGTNYLVSWSRKWQPTPVFLPGKFHGQRSLVGCSPWDLKESDMTERLSAHIHLVSTLYPRSCHPRAYLAEPHPGLNPLCLFCACPSKRPMGLEKTTKPCWLLPVSFRCVILPWILALPGNHHPFPRSSNSPGNAI